MYTLTYSSTRSEVWRWYWRAWAAPTGLWRLHFAAALAIALLVWLSGVSPIDESRRFFIASTIWIAAAFLAMVLWPQLRFKPAQRTLMLDSDGWETESGRSPVVVPGKTFAAWKTHRGWSFS